MRLSSLEQILEIEALAPDKGGEIVEKQGKADDTTVFLGEDHLGGMFHKKGMINGGFVGHNLIGAFLVNGEFLDEFKDKTCLIRLRWTDSELSAHSLTVFIGQRYSFFQHLTPNMFQRGWQHFWFHHLKRGVELFE